MRTLIVFFSLLTLAQDGLAAKIAKAKKEEVVRDLKLEKRLVVPRIYITRKGDSLERIAHLLYGHSTWAVKIQKYNKKLRKFRVTQKLPAGLKVNYSAPKVGQKYVVQKGDWLIRIAEWKYKSRDQWKDIYEKNEKLIDNPNIIFPGDVLHFDGNGGEKKGWTVTRKQPEPVKSVEVVEVARLIPPPTPVPIAPTPTPEPFYEVLREPASQVSKNLKEFSTIYLFAGGCLLGLMCLFLFLHYRANQFGEGVGAAPHSDSGSQLNFNLEAKARGDKNDLRTKSQNLDVNGELDRRPGYHSLLLKRLKKYLK